MLVPGSAIITDERFELVDVSPHETYLVNLRLNEFCILGNPSKSPKRGSSASSLEDLSKHTKQHFL